MAATAYPKISSKGVGESCEPRRRTLRPPKFTPSTVAALMEMSSPNSALRNTVRPMRQLGLIDGDGALTDRWEQVANRVVVR